MQKNILFGTTFHKGCKRVGNKHCKIPLVHKNMWYSPFFTTFKKGCSKSIHLYDPLYDHLYVQSLIHNVIRLCRMSGFSPILISWQHIWWHFILTKLGNQNALAKKPAPKRRTNVEYEYRLQFWTAYMVTVLNTIYTNKVGKSKCARQKSRPKKAVPI